MEWLEEFALLAERVFRLTGEFHLRLRHLEKSLLQALNDAKGRILDDDRSVAGRDTGNDFLTSLPLVSVRRHGLVTR